MPWYRVSTVCAFRPPGGAYQLMVVVVVLLVVLLENQMDMGAL